MSVFKCKMCGGTIEFNQGDTVGVCDSCGTKQTLPRIDDEKRANLYDRADHYRRANDYDKAIGIYEQILNEDATDAEAYWSLVLCKYGIEYVEDPLTHKRIPTVNRAQYTSIFVDEDYKSALNHADVLQREIYEEEANTIDGIQKGILEIADKEEPFDVFICYKESDNSGRRTQDSVLAYDLYKELTSEGLKVFFARVTLEDKLGTAYEPYIFAALNSAKVMVVVGTRQDYFNAVWVKNEWSRYLSLIRKGEKKTLIPAYRDMDPYDLPEEFSHLQAQDMSKLGFMQDLVRGIKKIVDYENSKQVKQTLESKIIDTETLEKRTFIALEDGEWEKADEFIEQILTIDPENPKAYLGKLLVDLKVKSLNELEKVEKPFNENKNYIKVIKFADTNMSSKMQEVSAGVIERFNKKQGEELSKKEEKRKKLNKIIKIGSIVTVSTAVVAIGGFVLIKAYLIPELNYKKGVEAIKNGNYEEGIEILEAMSGYKESDSMVLSGKYEYAKSLNDLGQVDQSVSILNDLYVAENEKTELAKKMQADSLLQTLIGYYLEVEDYDNAEELYGIVSDELSEEEKIDILKEFIITKDHKFAIDNLGSQYKNDIELSDYVIVKCLQAEEYGKLLDFSMYFDNRKNTLVALGRLASNKINYLDVNYIYPYEQYMPKDKQDYLHKSIVAFNRISDGIYIADGYRYYYVVKDKILYGTDGYIPEYYNDSLRCVKENGEYRVVREGGEDDSPISKPELYKKSDTYPNNINDRMNELIEEFQTIIEEKYKNEYLKE